MDLLVDVMHGIQEEAFLATCIQANAVHSIVPLPLSTMQPLNDTCPSLVLVVPIAYEEHATGEELEVRARSQFGFKLSVDSGPVRAPGACILIRHEPLLSVFIADGYIKYRGSRAVPVCELRLQLLHIICQCRTDQRHIHHSAQWNIKSRGILWRNPHALNDLNGVHLLQNSQLILVELQQCLVLLFITDVHGNMVRGPELRGCLPRPL